MVAFLGGLCVLALFLVGLMVVVTLVIRGIKAIIFG